MGLFAACDAQLARGPRTLPGLLALACCGVTARASQLGPQVDPQGLLKGLSQAWPDMWPEQHHRKGLPLSDFDPWKQTGSAATTVLHEHWQA